MYKILLWGAVYGEGITLSARHVSQLIKILRPLSLYVLVCSGNRSAHGKNSSETS
jgi:hypothetical protein